jgi:hypothetical protein
LSQNKLTHIMSITEDKVFQKNKADTKALQLAVQNAGDLEVEKGA